MWDIDPEFSAAGLGIGIAVIAYMAVLDPLLGRFLYRRLERDRDTDPRAFTRFYAVTTAVWVVVAAAAAGAVLLSPGVSFAELGFRLGHPDALPFWVVFPLIFCAMIGGYIAKVRARDGQEIAGLAETQAMLPRTADERRTAVLFGVVDGICSHLVVRGLVIALAIDLLGVVPGLLAGTAVSVLISAAAAFYMGTRVVLGAGFVGLLAAGLYLGTTSLIAPTLLVIAFMLRDLLMLPAGGPAPRTQPEGA